MRRVDGRDVLVLLGIVLVGTGLWYFDWRIALITVGVVLAALGLIGALRNG